MAQFAVGLAMGALASLAISLGLIATFLAFALIALIAALRRSLLVLSGGLLAMGGIWLTLGLNVQRTCLPTPNSCGEGDYVPFISIAALLVALGMATTALSWWRNNRRSAPTP
jgi:hypothetical protein